MKALLIGSGGREHALAWALSQDSKIDEVYAAPGNPGIAQIATCVPLDAKNIEQLAPFASDHKIDLTVVGPEAPLALGIVDHFSQNGLRIFGPTKAAAQVESSKTFAKELCARNRIPTPRWQTFSNAQDASRMLKDFGPPWVVKADGLAAGKGTTVTRDLHEAKEAVKREFQRTPGRVVLEEFIDGWEATFMATVSGGRLQWLMPVFQDYKPVYDNDVGANTGGMGCYSPVPRVTPSLLEKVKDRILAPSLAGMEKMGVHYQGVLNLNAIVKNGTEDPLVLEFNARFGDPEGQGVMMLTESGLADHLYAIASDAVGTDSPKTRGSSCVLVVLASKGYPNTQSLGDRITIRPIDTKNATIFHAGTSRNSTGDLVTAGGRVLNVAAIGSTVESARREAYNIIGSNVDFDGMHFRSDIGAVEKRRQRTLQVTRA